jgi:hypothetical protein
MSGFARFLGDLAVNLSVHTDRVDGRTNELAHSQEIEWI